MGARVSQITSLTIVYSTVYSDADQRKYQSSASLAFVRGIHRGRVNSPHKWPVTQKMFPFDNVIMVTHKILPHTYLQTQQWWVWPAKARRTAINSDLPGQNGRHFADNTFKRISLNENVRDAIKISLKVVPRGPINNIPALVQIMAWRRPGDKPLSEPMLYQLTDAYMRHWEEMS